MELLVRGLGQLMSVIDTTSHLHTRISLLASSILGVLIWLFFLGALAPALEVCAAGEADVAACGQLVLAGFFLDLLATPVAV